MKNILILGAAGQIARHVVDALLDDRNVRLTLYLRQPSTLADRRFAAARKVRGDVLDRPLLEQAMRGQDIVYANLSGELDKQAEVIVAAMKAAGVRRLIFIAAMGIYDEAPGAFGDWNNRMAGVALVPYRRAAAHIEASGLDYTIIRPTWITDADEIDYEITAKGQAMRGAEVSRKSVADLVIRLLGTPDEWIGASLGINKPDTYWDMPSLAIRQKYGVA